MPAGLTRLQAVNQCLRALSESPVNSLLTDQSTDVEFAQAELDNATLQLCEDGYWFNQDNDVSLQPNTEGEITVPANVLYIDSEPRDRRDVVIRNGRLWDRGDRTHKFDSPVRATVTYLIDFDKLPSHARTYVAAKAASRLCETQLPGSANYQAARQREVEAHGAWQRYENEQSDINASTSNVYSQDIHERSLSGHYGFNGRRAENDLY